jgi:hypothetical protein
VLRGQDTGQLWVSGVGEGGQGGEVGAQEKAKLKKSPSQTLMMFVGPETLATSTVSGTSMGDTKAVMVPGASTLATPSSLMVCPMDLACSKSALDTMDMPVVGTSAVDRVTPYASRAKSTSLDWASQPSTSAEGSAGGEWVYGRGATARGWSSDRGRGLLP